MVISPATTTRPVVSSVSHATRLVGSPSRMASRTASEIWSAILSGWPSVTDSEVKVVFTCCSASRRGGRSPYPRRRRPLHPWRSAGPRCALPSAPEDRDRVGVVVEPDARARSRRWRPGGRRPCARSLRRPRSSDVVGLGREADQHLARRRRRRPGRPGCRASARGRARAARPPWTACVPAVALGRKSATAAAITTTSAPRPPRRTACLHLGRRLDVDPGHRRRTSGGSASGDEVTSVDRRRRAAPPPRRWRGPACPRIGW